MRPPPNIIKVPGSGTTLWGGTSLPVPTIPVDPVAVLTMSAVKKAEKPPPVEDCSKFAAEMATVLTTLKLSNWPMGVEAPLV